MKVSWTPDRELCKNKCIHNIMNIKATMMLTLAPNGVCYAVCIPQFVPGLLAKPLHHQRLEAAVDEPILQGAQTRNTAKIKYMI